MDETQKPLLIKRYASRRLYNTETSDYVTLEEIADFIRAGRDVQIVDLKTGEDLTRQYLLQIIADQETRGQTVLPVDVLTELVRSYTAQAQAALPQVLRLSLEMLRQGPAMAETLAKMNPIFAQMKSLPGFQAVQRQQEAVMQAMLGTFANLPGFGAGSHARNETEPHSRPSEAEPRHSPEKAAASAEELAAIRQQLSELERKLAMLLKNDKKDKKDE